MSVTKTIVRRPTTIFIVFVLIIGLGIYAASDLAIDLYPEIDPPILLVITNYPGAGPEEVEKSVTRPLEGTLSNVSNIENITSTSTKGNSMVQLEFTYGTDMSEASNSIRDSLEIAKSFLPEETETPMIFKFDPSMIPIMGLTLSGPRTPAELRRIAEDVVQPRVEQVEGVAMTGLSGGRERAIRVEVSQNRLAAYDLALTQVANMMRGQNVEISAGSITEGPKNYLVQTSGRYESIDAIRDTVVAYKTPGGTVTGMQSAPMGSGGGPTGMKTVRLRDIATVYDGYKDPETLVFINGEPGIQIIVQKQSGTNSVQVTENVRNRLSRINKEVPRGVRVEEIFNTTDIIKSSLSQVASSAILGAVFAVLILFVFLRSLKSTFIIGLTIPISLVVTLMVMYFADLTLNIMTLAGLALGVGMLVDNSIVILENIYRYREKGAKLTASAILGTQEMINAIVASTLTTISVFAPVALFKNQLDVTGELLASLSFTVVIALLSSLAVAMMLIPVLSSHYLPLTSRRQRPLRGRIKRIDERMARAFTGLDEAYKRAVGGVLKHKVITIIVVAALFGGAAYTLKDAPFEFLPSQAEDSVNLELEMPLGTKLEATESVLKEMEQVIKEELDSYEKIILEVGQRSSMGFLGSVETHRGSLRIELLPFDQRSRSAEEIKQVLRQHFNRFPGATFSFGGQGFGGPGGMNPIDILVQTSDLEKGRKIAEQIRDVIEREVPQVTEPTVGMNAGLPELEISIDRNKLYALGLNVSSVGQEIQANVDGVVASTYEEGGTEYDIQVMLEEEDRNEELDLEQIFVTNSSGTPIPLASFASYEKTTGPVDIERENQSRVIHVTGGLVPGAALNEVEMQVREAVKEQIPTEEDVIIQFTGDYEDLMKYGTRLVYILLVAVFLVFGVMASQFESFLDPFIILFTVPLSLIGVIGLYMLTGETYSLLTAVGMVMLAGIIVNNAIVLVDYINLLRKRGRGIRDACIEAGGNRLRPILMTTFTTILALVPMAFFPGQGSELVSPIAKTVVGGLTVGALLTLFLVPVIYAIFNRMAEKRELKKKEKRRLRRERRRQLEAQKPWETEA